MEREVCKVAVATCSYKGPDVHCFGHHYEFMHYLGRLQERSALLNEAERGEAEHLLETCHPLERIIPDSQAEWRAGEPAFEFYNCEITGSSIIGQARDLIIERALKSNMDYVFMFDDDMLFARDCFLRLWRRQKEYIGALAFTARPPITPVLYKFNRVHSFKKKEEKLGIEPVWEYEKDALVRVDAIGTGVVLLKTSIFEKLSQPWFHGAISSGEDIHFAFKCGEAGIPVYCDTGVKTIHKPNQPEVWYDEIEYLKSQERLKEKHGADSSDTDLQQLEAVS